MHSLKVRSRRPDSVVATWGPFLIVAWLGQGDPSTIRAMHQISMELSKPHPEGIGHLHLIENNIRGSLTEETRKGIVELLRDRSVGLVGAAVVIPGAGFLSAVMRSTLAGAVLLARSAAKVRFLPSVRDAEAFLRSLSHRARTLEMEAGALIGAVDSLRKEWGSAPELLNQ